MLTNFQNNIVVNTVLKMYYFNVKKIVSIIKHLRIKIVLLNKIYATMLNCFNLFLQNYLMKTQRNILVENENVIRCYMIKKLQHKSE